MAIPVDVWQARAAMCELLALSFRYPGDGVLAGVAVSGEWYEAADEIAEVLGLNWAYSVASGANRVVPPHPNDFQKSLCTEATRLFVGSPEAVCSPYEGVWRARANGIQPLLFVNPYSMAVERFCKKCGLGRFGKSNEPFDAIWVELELLEYLATSAMFDANRDFRDGDENGVANAWDGFMADHVRVWVPLFAKAVQDESRVPLYRDAASLLASFVE